jgi:hypothetical protein
MENTVIQIGSNSVRRVEDLVASVCYDNHLANYHAIISVPLLATIQSLFRQNPDASLLLACSHSRKGLYFDITVSADALHVGENNSEHPLSPDVMSLVSQLADGVELSDRTIRLLFCLNGIGYNESERRRSVLARFYQPVLVES